MTVAIFHAKAWGIESPCLLLYNPTLLTYSNFHLCKPQTPIGAVRELPLRYGLPIREWL